MSGVMGFRKEKKPLLVALGLRYRMLMPMLIKGLEKSMTFSRIKLSEEVSVLSKFYIFTQHM
ncbi:hypothetical protein EYF80_000407 [Liparis tanakae]|uniref:Uncharacterized protein n=1 Tax=Liparis tanakae TaxID=230148 RepID=A0A4Z2JFT4_9TELE|nr:hypothetical protein EYF80_000407 [Liparis tanakae]